MPIIAYQSFNANASSTHGVKALAFQRFTKDANKHAVSQGHKALVLPYIPGNVSAPVEGPAELKPIEVLVSPQPVDVFGAQISLLWQNFYREFGAMPDMLMCGEIDTSHADWDMMIEDDDITQTPIIAKRACQSFTAISQTSVASQLEYLMSGEGYAVYKVAGVVVVFVHVPNKVATSKYATEDFYNKIGSRVIAKGLVIHLVIGDTNQPNFNYSAAVLNRVFNTQAYATAGAGGKVEKIDGWSPHAGSDGKHRLIEKGTNAKGTAMYDVAVYRSDLLDMEEAVAYLSQSSSGVTITDHAGVAVKVALK